MALPASGTLCRKQNPVESENLECNMEHVTDLNMDHAMDLEVNQNSNHARRMKDFYFRMHLYYNCSII